LHSLIIKDGYNLWNILNGIFCPLRKKLSLGFLIRALIIATAGGKRLGRNTCILIAFFTFFSIGLGVIWYTSQHHLKTQNSEETVYTQANSYEDRISQVAAQVSPSIVGISNLSRSKDIFSQNLVESTGSGVILDQEGYIVTNNHVVRGAESINVTLADGNEEQAEIIGSDPQTDLALIKIKVDNHVTPIKLGDSESLVVGQEVLAIGNPLGQRFARSVTAGIVSGLNRLLTTEEGLLFPLIQTDAAINPGNSGGALVNLEGELVGINTIKIAESGFEGMGFSIPSNQVKAVIEELKTRGRVERPRMGIKVLGEISQEKAGYYQLPVKGGVIVEPVSGGSAEKAGLKAFDLIYAIDGKEIATGLELQAYILQKKRGESVRVAIIRVINEESAQVEKRSIKIILS
jgi:serine protease Do